MFDGPDRLPVRETARHRRGRGAARRRLGWHPDAGPRRTGLGGLRPGSGPDALDPARRGRGRLHRSHQYTDHHPAERRLRFVPPDDRRLPARGRFVHRCQGEPWHQRRSDRGGGPDARLRPGGRRRDLGGDRRPGLGLVNPPALHPLALPGDARLHHPGEPPGGPRVGRGVPAADLSVHRVAAGRDRHRDRQVDHGRRPSRAGRDPAGPAHGGDGGDLLAVDAVVRKWLHGDDGRRGRQQRRRGLSGAVGPPCQARP